MSNPTPPKISRYLPLWNRLKTHKVCAITAHPKFHKTIIKMVKNRRDKDFGYRFMQGELGIREQIKATVDGSIVTFKLKRMYGLGDI